VIWSLVVGLITGGFLGWAGNYLPRWKADRSEPISSSTAPFEPALWSLFVALLRRQSWRQFAGPFWLHAAIELVPALVFPYLLESVGLTWNLFGQGLLCSFLVLVALIDLRYQLVLNVLVFPAALLVLFSYLLMPERSIINALVGSVFGSLIFLFAALLRPGELGAGDVKLAALIGLIFVFPSVLWALMIGVLSGGFAAVFLLLTHRGNRSSQMPYAPFLCLGALIGLFYNPVSLILRSVLR
jgi:prepilin signal peptidase PulO-like enzyme (type II secretory pathway)